MQQEQQDKIQERVHVWDVPTRLFHWSLAGLMFGLWWTADNGEMDWHLILAYVLGALLLFRWCWGVIGSDTARFAQFVKSPSQVIGYLQQLRQQGVQAHYGHNPLGAYMVIALLLLLSGQVITGLFATDGIFTEGPLYALVSDDSAELLTWLHKKNFDLLLLLIGLHIGAVFFHELKGDHLIGAMITGRRSVMQGSLVGAMASPKQALWKALVLFALFLLPLFYYFILPLYQNLS